MSSPEDTHTHGRHTFDIIQEEFGAAGVFDKSILLAAKFGRHYCDDSYILFIDTPYINVCLCEWCV